MTMSGAPSAPVVLTAEQGARACNHCPAAPGQRHGAGCEIAQCVGCGTQAVQCDEHDEFPMQVWTGEYPGLAECRELGYWSRWTVVTEYSRDGLPDSGRSVPCAPDHPHAREGLNELAWDGARRVLAWSQVRERWVRPADCTTCDTNPATTDGPDVDCDRHGARPLDADGITLLRSSVGSFTGAPESVGDEHTLFYAQVPGPGWDLQPLTMSTARLNFGTVRLVEVVDMIARTIEGAPDRLASSTTDSLVAGPHAWGKKIVEEAYELGCAIEHESDEQVALEASQLIYRLLVGVMGRGVAVRDVLRRL